MFEGRRLRCKCIKSISIKIGNDCMVIFKVKHMYRCIQTNTPTGENYYKVIGTEFDFNGNENEFLTSFILVENKYRRQADKEIKSQL